jgi:putative ABC transport system permease protein
MSAMFWLGWHVIAGYARQHRLRALVQVLAIAIGVALGYAVHLINTSALAEFSSAVRAVTGQADASITATREGFDERLFERVVTHPAVELASPLLQLDVPVLTGAARTPLLPVVGLDVFRAGALSESLLPVPAEPASRFALFDDGIYLSPAALDKFGVKPGDTLRVQVGAKVIALPIVGTLPGSRAGQLIGVMDLGFAQWRLDQLGRLTRIDLKLAAGAASLLRPPTRSRRACPTFRAPTASTSTYWRWLRSSPAPSSCSRCRRRRRSRAAPSSPTCASSASLHARCRRC